MNGALQPWAEGSLDAQQERVTAILAEAFTRDLLGLEEYERRVTAVGEATATHQLDALLADLPVEVTGPARFDEMLDLATQQVGSVMGQRTLQGDWLRSRNVEVKVVMSQVTLDFRDVALPPGSVELKIRAIMSEVVIKVSRDVVVEMDVMPVMAEVRLGKVSPTPDPGAVPRCVSPAWHL